MSILPRVSSSEAVSEVIGFLLAFAVTSLIIGGSLVAMADLQQRSNERFAKQEADAVAHQIAAEILDLAERTPPGGTGNRTLDIPHTIQGRTYTITLTASPAEVTLSPAGVDYTASAPLLAIHQETTVCGATVDGGTVIAQWNATCITLI